MSEIKYSIIIPSYNEAENLKILLPRLIAMGNEYLLSYEVLVIDANISLDNTKEICQDTHIVYVNRTPANFYGDAIRTGIAIACGKFIISMDADGSHPPEFIPTLIANADSNDLVIASRYIKGGYTENKASLVWMSKLLNLVYSYILKINIYDISNSFRCYRAEKVKSLTLECNNFDVAQEIIMGLIRTFPNLKTHEEPFHFMRRLHGKSKRHLSVFIYSYFKTLFKLYRLSRKHALIRLPKNAGIKES
jgi:dolichol-phosphate mannosyltransferase